MMTTSPTESLFTFLASAGFPVRDTGAVRVGDRSVFVSVRPNGTHVIMHQSSRGSSYQTFKAGKVSARAKLLAELVYLDNLHTPKGS